MREYEGVLMEGEIGRDGGRDQEGLRTASSWSQGSVDVSLTGYYTPGGSYYIHMSIGPG